MGKARRFCHKDSSDKRLPNRVYPYRRTSRNTIKESQPPKPRRELLEPFIHNLSSTKLSDVQMSALAKGLKHIPTPNTPKRTELVTDVNQLHRRMRIRYLMRNKHNSTPTHQFKLPSTWTPIDSGNHTLEDYLERTKEEICHLRFYHPQQNLTKKERKALNDLSKDHTITIKKLDKGRGVALMNTHDYIQIGLKHLSTHHYQLIPDDPTMDTARSVHDLLFEMNELNYIDDDTFFFLDPYSHNTRTSEMYFLPKLHKLPPKDALFEIRPIMSGIDSATYHISKFADFFLAPIAASQSTYIRDSTDIILKLQNLKLPPNALLASIDVKAMYTNIDHEMAIRNASEAYKSTKIHYNIKKIPTKYLTKMLHLILECNTFKFNGLNYKQCIGLAMGSPCSVSLATIAMHPLEKAFLERAENIIAFYRYIDDIILISSGPSSLLDQQIKDLNSLHHSLKFSAEISPSSINFLDLTIYKPSNFNSTGILATKVYSKSCDTFQYILPTSTHPPATFKAFIYGEFLRFVRNCSEEDEFNNRCEFFKEKLIIRGYTEDFVSAIQHTISYQNRNTILRNTGTKSELDKNNIPLVFTTTYTGHLTPKDIKTALLKNWHLIENNPELNQTFKEPPLIAFRRATNIQDKIIKSKLPENENIEILMDLLEDQ